MHFFSSKLINNFWCPLTKTLHRIVKTENGFNRKKLDWKERSGVERSVCNHSMNKACKLNKAGVICIEIATLE